MVTIIDIANRCGVSTATVSYALNGKGNISDEMRSLIQKTASDMGYIPNQAARNLQNGKSNLIGVIIPNLTVFFNNQVFSYIEKELAKRGLSVMVGCLSGKTTAIELFERIVAQKPLGIICFPSGDWTEETLLAMDKIVAGNSISTVVTLRQGQAKHLKFLDWDIATGVEKITESLLEKGIQDTFFFGNSISREERYIRVKYEGYLRAYEKRGLSAPDFLCDMGETYEEAYQYTLSYIENGNRLPRAIVAVNDIAGYGIVSALEEKGVKVPQQVCVVGVDGIRFDYAKYKLTTVTPDLKVLAKKCVDMICRFEEYENGIYTLENQIVEGSTS